VHGVGHDGVEHEDEKIHRNLCKRLSRNASFATKKIGRGRCLETVGGLLDLKSDPCLEIGTFRGFKCFHRTAVDTYQKVKKNC